MYTAAVTHAGSVCAWSGHKRGSRPHASMGVGRRRPAPAPRVGGPVTGRLGLLEGSPTVERGKGALPRGGPDALDYLGAL